MKCPTCGRRHREGSAVGKAHKPTTPTPVSPMPSVCPTCGGKLIDYPTGRWCPAEDPHPGGLFIRLDGTVRQWSIIGVSSIH